MNIRAVPISALWEMEQSQVRAIQRSGRKVLCRSLVHSVGSSHGMKWPPLGWAVMLTWLYQAAQSLARKFWTRSSGVRTPGGFS